MQFVITCLSIGGFIWTVKDHGGRLKKLEQWREAVVDEKLNSIENKLDIFITEQKGDHKVQDEKYNNIISKLDEMSLWKK